jgi:hypothetical protein
MFSVNNQTNSLQNQLNLTNKTLNNKKLPSRGNSTNQTGNYNNPNPLIIKNGEISILSNVKNDEKLVIRKVIFDEKGKFKINNEAQDELDEIFLQTLLNPYE